MQFLRSPDFSAGAWALGQTLTDHLSRNQRVLWFVSGGSNIAISVAVMANLDPGLDHLLTIMLADERYGPPGHADSNAEELIRAGFKPRSAHWLSVLTGQPLTETTHTYRAAVSSELAQADIAIGQFGIGEDGHLAGILPHSPAAEPTDDLVVSYESQPFTRLTMTFAAIRRLDAAFVFAYGVAKRPALQDLQSGELALADQPASILHALEEAYVYNDQIGESL